MKTINNIKFVLRSFTKNKSVTLLNILGLTVGLTVSLFIFIFVINQNNIDRFIPNIDKVYCLMNSGETYFSQNEINLVKEQVPSIDKITYCTADWSPQVFLKAGEKSIKTEKMITADSCFFRVFAFEPVYGNPAEALNTSNKVVLTRSFSEKLFGNENPVGKTVTYNSTYLQGELLEVTAVIEDFPATSSWDFEAVLSFQTNYKIDWYVTNMNQWGTHNYKAFVRINSNVSPTQVIAEFGSISLKSVPDWVAENFKLGLFPFSEIYFNLSEIELTKHGNRLTVSIIGVTGILILLLACINYINMVTAQREKRNKNIGIIKMLGGNRNKVIQMITAESFIQVVFSGAFSILLISLLLPVFNNLTSLNLRFSELFQPYHIVLIVVLFVFMIAVTGIVPGILFSRKIPLTLLKKQSPPNESGISRNGLLVFQFIVTIALIASILLVNKQSSYLQNQELGFEKGNIIYAFTNDDLYKKSEAFKNEVRGIPDVTEITYSADVLIENGQNWGCDFINKGEETSISFSKLSVAPNFFQFFGIPLSEGRGFNDNSNTKQEFIFNRTAKEQFKLDNIIEARLKSSKPENGQVVGIVDNYNFESLHMPIRAAGFMSSGNFDDVIYLKLNSQSSTSFKSTMKQVELVWNKFSPAFPLEYFFLDKKWEAKYAKDQQFQRIILYTTLVSILLSCLGLIGLTFFVMERRTKEIGIRKVNGAKVSEILAMLNRDFIKWVAIAFVIATPIAYYVMHKWLENFAYKTELSWWIFALAGVLALAIALLTVSFQSWRAATRNPVEALRYE
ncbi:MAG: ABC transporter permease [Mangrovibacterium sp.]